MNEDELWRALLPIIILLTISLQVARLVAQVARFGAIRAVPGDMAGTLAIVTGVVGHPVHAPGLGATARNMARLSAVVAGRHVRALHAVFGEVALAVAAVATGRVLFAIAGKVPDLVALVALFAIPVVTAPASAVSAPRLGALPGKMAGLVTLVTNAS